MPQVAVDTPGHPVNGAGAEPAATFRFSDRDEPADTFAAATPQPLLFTGHALPAGRLQPTPHKIRNPDWFIGALFLLVAYYTALRALYGRVLRNLFGAFTSTTVANQAVRDENLLMQRTSVLLSVLFYFSGGLFLYTLSTLRGWENPYLGEGFQQFFLFTVLLGTAYAVKLVLLKLLGFVLHAGKLVSQYIFNVFLINNVLGVVLVPLLACIAFLPPAIRPYLVYGTAAMIGLLWVFRIVRGIRSWFGMPHYSVYYLILYLCAFEFAPLIVIFKLV